MAGRGPCAIGASAKNLGAVAAILGVAADAKPTLSPHVSGRFSRIAATAARAREYLVGRFRQSRTLNLSCSEAGFERVLAPVSTVGTTSTDIGLPGAEEEPSIFDRPLAEQFTSRHFRDAAFGEAVKSAYHNTCAITGLKIINGRRRAEVQAAHTRPVAASGPDSVRNFLPCAAQFTGCLIVVCFRWTIISGSSYRGVVFPSHAKGISINHQLLPFPPVAVSSVAHEL